MIVEPYDFRFPFQLIASNCPCEEKQPYVQRRTLA